MNGACAVGIQPQSIQVFCSIQDLFTWIYSVNTLHVSLYTLFKNMFCGYMWHYIIQINSHWHYQICRHQWSFRDLNDYWLPTVLEILQRFQRKQGYGRTMKDSRSHLISDWRFEIPLTNIYQYLLMSIYLCKNIYIRRCSWRQCLFYLRIYGFYCTSTIEHNWFCASHVSASTQPRSNFPSLWLDQCLPWFRFDSGRVCTDWFFRCFTDWQFCSFSISAGQEAGEHENLPVQLRFWLGTGFSWFCVP